MPTFYSKAVTIQVSVANLARTTTLGIPSSHSIEHIQRVFAEESVLGTLFENPVHSDAEDEGPLLQFLGESVPLYMRQVGKNFFDINAKKNRYIWPKRVPDGVEARHPKDPRQRRPPQQPPTQRAHAISVTAFLSPESFEPYSKVRPPLTEGGILRDVRIDAYFNGALLSSRVVANRFASSKHLTDDLIVRITGRIVGGDQEQALILVPPGQNPDGTLQEHKRKKGSALQRWKEISQRLDEEIENLSTADAIGSSADSLRELARIEMPVEVEQLHKGGHTFSIVDLVVTSGTMTGKPVPDVVVTREGKLHAQDIVFPTSQREARRSTSSTGLADSAVVAGSSRTTGSSPRKSSTGPSSLQKVKNPQMKPGYGYAFVSEPRETREEKFQKIQTDAKNSCSTAAEGEVNTKRSRTTRAKTRETTTTSDPMSSSPSGPTVVEKSSPPKLKVTSSTAVTAPIKKRQRPRTLPRDSPDVSPTSALPSAPSALSTTTSPCNKLKRARSNSSDTPLLHNYIHNYNRNAGIVERSSKDDEGIQVSGAMAQHKKFIEGGALTMATHFRPVANLSTTLDQAFVGEATIGIYRYIFY